MEREARAVTIHSLETYEKDGEFFLKVHCSRGTYIRTLCADIGKKLGCGGCMASLRRTSVGQFDEKDSVPLDVLREFTPEQVEEFRTFIEEQGMTFLPISAATRKGLDDVPGMVYGVLRTLPEVTTFEVNYVKPEANADGSRFTVTKLEDHVFSVEAPWLERILEGSDVEDYESLQYFQRALADNGVLDELIRQGVEEDDTICIGVCCTRVYKLVNECQLCLV